MAIHTTHICTHTQAYMKLDIVFFNVLGCILFFSKHNQWQLRVESKTPILFCKSMSPFWMLLLNVESWKGALEKEYLDLPWSNSSRIKERKEARPAGAHGIHGWQTEERALPASWWPGPCFQIMF